ncbi:hypothetical protein [Rhabdaerophilum calidifontis]|uniref:hypothetical protein n=1 Tax=Rhabdaerophilum calidifontis TaxID=2604328 RepID=UPI00123AA580|nr:hypothetical protein [Rhabdaerophilum calidifontis]
MLWRISAAIVALTLVHGADRTRQDGVELAGTLRERAPEAVIRLCADQAARCIETIGQAAGLARVAATPKTAEPEPLLALPAGAYPLPPRRPAHPRA